MIKAIKPYFGVDRCNKCKGFGSFMTLQTPPLEPEYSLCPVCGGTGRQKDNNVTQSKTENNLSRLEAAALKAGGKPWYCDGVTNSGLTIVTDCIAGSRMYPITAETFEAQYIEAANPAAVLELITYIRDLQGRLRLLKMQK